MKNQLNSFKCLAIAVAMLGFPVSSAFAQAVVTNGTITLGVNAEGHLNYSDGTSPENSAVWGLSFFADYDGGGADWRDATSPGCYCEGFGVKVTTDPGGVTHTGYANVDSDGGAVNLTAGVSVSDADSILTTATIASLPGLTVTHDYQPSSSPNLYEVTVTIANTTGDDLSDVMYRRVMDWDVPPTEFDEFVTIQGALLGNLVYSSDDGFCTAEPGNLFLCGDIAGGTTNTNFVDSGPDDHGAVFDFNFGDLADGASRTFQIYYGAAGTEAAALAALAAVGAQGIYSFGQSVDGQVSGSPATFIFGFGGVGAPPIETTTTGGVPEPSTLLLLGGALGGLAIRRRRGTKA